MRTGRHVEHAARWMRKGESAVPVVSAVVGLALVCGAAYLLVPSGRPQIPVSFEANRTTVDAPTVAAPSARVLSPSSVASGESSPSVSETVADASLADETGTAPLAASAAVPSRLEQVQAHLEAGEFGPAIEIALAATDAVERTQLLKLVAAAQLAAGEFDAALTSIRRIPIPEERNEARGQQVEQRALAGGGADFTELVDLIQNETEGPWEEIDGDGGTVSQFTTGVIVDPNGVLTRLTREEQTGRLESLGVRARSADLNEDMARSSSLRLVSLRRLEQEVSRRLADGKPVVETMKQLAGLTQIQYVFVYPEAGEIVIAGPAEGWRYNENGLPVGAESGRPTLQLDDFVTVLRTFQPGGKDFFDCLIVPRQENMRALEAYVAKSNDRGPLRAGAGVRNWVHKLEETLGEQDVVVNGVPLDSRVARVIVEADYRMKLIGIDKLDGGDIRSYFDLLPEANETASTTTIGLRWWMTMKYDAVLHSSQRDAFEVQGSSVLCLSENELITPDGQRIHTGKSSPANSMFAREFTEHFAQLAQHDSVFADMQNIFDLALVAALIRNERLDERANWNLGSFQAGGLYQPARFETPKTVMTVANHRVYNGKDIVVQVAGGVRADLMTVVKDVALLKMVPRLKELAASKSAPQLPEGRWWWDAAE